MDSLLPPNATQLERNVAAVNARIGELPVPLRLLMNPDTCPAPARPYLASYMSVDGWDATWSDTQQREIIKASLGVHRIKGTIGAVKQALSALGFKAELQEWFNQVPKGKPYTYRLLLDAAQVGFDRKMLMQIDGVLGPSKNIRSHLAEVAVSVTSAVTPVMAAVSSIGTEVTVQYGGPTDFSLLVEGYKNGEEQTEAAAVKLDDYLNEILPMKWNNNEPAIRS